MGLSFRKSFKFGPLRLNLSRSGLGYSVGGKGFRVGRTAKGSTYTMASAGGVTWKKTYGSASSSTSPASPVPAPASHPVPPSPSSTPPGVPLGHRLSLLTTRLHQVRWSALSSGTQTMVLLGISLVLGLLVASLVR